MIVELSRTPTGGWVARYAHNRRVLGAGRTEDDAIRDLKRTHLLIGNGVDGYWRTFTDEGGSRARKRGGRR